MLLTRLHTSVVYATVAASVVCFWLLRSRAAMLLLPGRDHASRESASPSIQLGLPAGWCAAPTRRLVGHCGDHQLGALGIMALVNGPPTMNKHTQDAIDDHAYPEQE